MYRYLYPEEGVCIQVPEGEGEGLGELYAGWDLPLQQVLLIAIQVLSLLGRLAAQTEIDPSSRFTSRVLFRVTSSEGIEDGRGN